MLGLDRRADLVPRQALDGQRIHQTFQIGGEGHRVGGRGRHEEGHLVVDGQEFTVDGLGPFLNEAGEDQPPLQRRDRRVQKLFRRFQQGVGREVEFGLVCLAERDHPRQQGRAAETFGQHGRERPHRALRRQVERHGGEREGVVAERTDETARDKCIGERRQERRAGGDGENAGGGHGFHFWPSPETAGALMREVDRVEPGGDTRKIKIEIGRDEADIVALRG
jgi:hypothetical protein